MTNQPTAPETPSPPEPAVPELSASELRLEREHCALEMERLTLERDRLETERLRLERERDLYGGGSNALHVGIGVLCLAVAVVLALGLLFGYNAGLESGRLQAPAPRKVLVSDTFLRLLRETPSGTGAFAPPADTPVSASSTPSWVSLYARPAYSVAFGNLPLIR